MRACLHTLGCRLNDSETNIIRQKLEAASWQIVPFGQEADLAVINTCTVTAMAERKCRTAIRSFTRKNPNAFTAVVGCYSQTGSKILADIEGVDLIIGNQEKLNILEYVKLGKNNPPLIIKDKIIRDDFTIDFVGETEFARRANLKVQDGCDFMCSYCIIPRARGRSRSRKMDNLIDEAKSLVKRGAKEIILTGVNIGTYSYQDKGVTSVIEQLANIAGLNRIRISSIEPTTIDDQLLEWMDDINHPLVPYLHIPMQAGSNKILKAMKRNYTNSEFIEYINYAHNKVADLCIGTDIMVGFPGETDEDFQETLQIFKDNPIAYAHVFTYSQRDETPAKRLAEQVADSVKKSRSASLRSVVERRRLQFNQSFLGREFDVLFEDKKGDYYPGYTPNYIRVGLASKEDLSNCTRRVRLVSSVADFIEVELV